MDRIYTNTSLEMTDKLIYVYKDKDRFIFSLDEYDGFTRIGSIDVVLNQHQVNDLIKRLKGTTMYKIKPIEWINNTYTSGLVKFEIKPDDDKYILFIDGHKYEKFKSLDKAKEYASNYYIELLEVYLVND